LTIPRCSRRRIDLFTELLCCIHFAIAHPWDPRSGLSLIGEIVVGVHGLQTACLRVRVPKCISPGSTTPGGGPPHKYGLRSGSTTLAARNPALSYSESEAYRPSIPYGALMQHWWRTPCTRPRNLAASASSCGESEREERGRGVQE
jgi:hypothetical protein